MTRRNDPPNAERASDRAMNLAVVDGGQRTGKAFLMASSGETAGMVFPLTLPSMVIGRAPNAEIRVNEHAVSNEHARLEGSGGRYSITDLGSTNGTYVNGQRIVARVTLSGGDTIRTGATTFTFVTRETGTAAATLKLGGNEVSAPLTARAASPSPTPLREARALTTHHEEAEDAVSLTDVVRTVKTYWVYTKRYGWLAATATFFGIAAGIAQARLNPPPGAAWFEMTLATETRGGEENEAVKAPFVAAEGTFKSLPLIKRTLRELEAPDASDAVASDVQAALSFEPTGYNSKLFRGDYQDATAEQAVLFLSKHVEVYVNSEIDKLLKVMRADAEFDRSQEELAAQQIAKIRDRLIVFMNEHPAAVPKDAKAPDVPATRVPAGASATQLDTAILAAEQALAGSLRSIQSKKAATYVEQAASAESKIAEARSRGLADQHPEVKNLASLATTMRGKAAQLLSSEPTAAEQSLDPDVTRARQDLNDLRTKRAALPAPPASATSVAIARPAIQENLAQLKLQYAELAREYERAKTDHEALLKKRETTDRLLERERKSAEARYDIITPPTAEHASAFKAIVRRAGFGGGVGFGLALVAAVCLELRRILKARGHI